MTGLRPQRAPWRLRLHEIIFEAETPEGRGFDVALLLLIGLSVVSVVLESVAELRQAYGPLFRRVEWGVTIIFTIEYLLRLLAVRQPLRYAFSFFGLVDFLAIAPTYLSVFVAGAQSLLVIRALRLLRVFRVLKLVQFVGEARLLGNALRASRRKILVFLGTVMTLVIIIGALMYLIEGEASGFTSIPQSIYWTIVTMTTVGYGDIAPLTVAGKILACLVMVTGYGIIAVPTGIVTVELAEAGRKRISTQACPNCGRDGHDNEALFCCFCGASLEVEPHGGRGGADE